MPIIARSAQEIEDLKNKAEDANAEGSKYPGMSYEEGIAAALSWVLGEAEADGEESIL
jgi:hypothetical protein